MRLVSLTVENFRSIQAARKIPIAQMTTLIGPNNEGKSNILRALAIGMNTLLGNRPGRPRSIVHRHSIIVGGRRRLNRPNVYNWESDYPLRLQGMQSTKSSLITLEFELTPTEIGDFENAIDSRLNGTLPIAFAFKKDGLKISVAKQGRSQKVLNAKADLIADFVADRLGLQYIPAVRTAAAAREIVDGLVASELAKVEDDPRYVRALADIAALQQPILDDLSRGIENTMRSFLPQIAGVKLTIEQQDRSLALRTASEIHVDDGAETALDYKGDGVQSLAALAIMRHASQAAHAKREVIIALEEPESHLHPRAIRELREVLEDLAKRHQVVVTTHNPLFTDRGRVESNIIVQNNRAYAAETIAQVRNILGVRLADNLSSAEVVLIVEGREDKIALSSILASKDAALKKELQSGRISIDILEGAGNLSHRARLHSDSLCKVHAFLDDDTAGRDAFAKAQREGVLLASDVNFARCGGRRDAELEDLYVEALYEEILKHEVGVTLTRQGPDKDKKWADRVRNLLRSAGRPHDEATLLAIKIKVAKAAANSGWAAVHPSKAGPLESLSNSLLEKLVAR